MLGLIGKLFKADDNIIMQNQLRRRNFKGELKPTDSASDPLYEALKGDRFVPEQSYFSVRLVEMRLAEGHNYIANFLPMCSCFLRYTYGDAQREVPFVVGYDMIRAALGKGAAEKGSQSVEFENIYIVRNAPVRPDGLLMYTALCRIADNSFARGMLDLLADAAGAIGGPAAGTIARTGVDMAKRLSGLLGAEGVTTRFGILDGAALGASGYRVFAGAGAETWNASKLTMEHGQLVQADGAGTTIDDVDYLVIALEYKKTLVDSAFGANSNLPFHVLWGPVKEKLLKGDLEGADQAYKDLTLRVVTSPDLVEADRLGILTTYRAQAEQWKKASSTISSLRGVDDNADITARLMDMAEGTGRRLEKPVASVLRSASDLISKQSHEKIPTAAVALDSSALTNTARSARTEFENSGASWEELSRASAHLASAVLNSRL